MIPSFPIGLNKTESALERLMLVVVVITVDAYPFLAFSELTCHLEDTVMCFQVALCCLIVRRPNMEVVSSQFFFCSFFRKVLIDFQWPLNLCCLLCFFTHCYILRTWLFWCRMCSPAITRTQINTRWSTREIVSSASSFQVCYIWKQYNLGRSSNLNC